MMSVRHGKDSGQPKNHLMRYLNQGNRNLSWFVALGLQWQISWYFNIEHHWHEATMWERSIDWTEVLYHGQNQFYKRTRLYKIVVGSKSLHTHSAHNDTSPGHNRVHDKVCIGAVWQVRMKIWPVSAEDLGMGFVMEGVLRKGTLCSQCKSLDQILYTCTVLIEV